MAGLYFHIPFCKQACHYCNFHFSTRLADIEQMVNTMIDELSRRKDYLNGEPLSSIYFGGGTPSILSAQELDQLFNTISRHFSIVQNPEITLEANPDDLTADKLEILAQSPVNRLSIGVQSFNENELTWMNRAHKASQAIEAIKMAQDKGLSNLSIDLIYGLPVSTLAEWENNLKTVVDLNIKHLSSYCLTVEDKTALAHQIKTKKVEPVNEEHAREQFELLRSFLLQLQFEQYEISNFAKEQQYAKHNTSYWQNEPYLGIGPSAHSYNKISRSWNISNNQQYMRLLTAGESTLETELLTDNNRFNEYIMTGLRTMWGCNKQRLEKEFPNQFSQIRKILNQQVALGHVIESETQIKLSPEALFLADGIASDLFV